MRPWAKVTLLVLVLTIVTAVSAVAQEQAPKNEAPPKASTQQTTTPQAAAPTETQTAAPAPSQEQPLGQKETPASAQPQSSATEHHATGTAKPQVKRKSVRSKKCKKPGGKQATEAGTQDPNSVSATSAEQPDKVVVKDGGAKDGAIQLSPGSTREQELHNRENTAQLLATTEENLKRLAGRQLTPSEQSTLDQIHSYVRQAKSAAAAGDLARAHTLAFKAHLLSDDLAKR